jgi:hypothetical protein
VRLSLLRIAALGASAMLAGADGAAASEHSPAEVAAHRQQILHDYLTDEFQPALIANLRESCAAGGEPTRVADSRAQGAYFTPDAADGCVAALVRTAHDGHLPELYRQLLMKIGGNVQDAEKWPRAVGAAVLGDSHKVPAGNHKSADVTPALAFDAGFTVGYQDDAADKAANADPAQLKPIAEACLAQRHDAGTCFSAGYLYGVQASRARSASVR